MPNIIINNYCNQKCSYCFAEDSMTIQKNPSNTQTLAVFLRILRYLKSYNYTDVRLLWGEPLLHKDIQKMLLLSYKWWFSILLFSNLNLPRDYLEEIFSDLPFTIRINCNLNNRDFYTNQEYTRLISNIQYLRGIGHEIIIGHNVYDISKPFQDILDTAKTVGSKRINIKITNTIAWKNLIVDTSDRAYGKYLYSIVYAGKDDFLFEFSCGLDKNIFSSQELSFFEQLGMDMKYGCSAAVWGYDIDIDGSIYKCFPLRNFYLEKGLSISTFNPQKHTIDLGIPHYHSDGICSAHKL